MASSAQSYTGADGATDARTQAVNARRASLTLQSLPAHARTDILTNFVALMQQNQHEIIEANQRDIQATANDATLSQSLKARLVLDGKKLTTLCDGITSIAKSEDLIGKVLQRTQVTDGLTLERVSVPLGVLLVIFESRPEVYPQLVALSIKTGNGILLKGGIESLHSLQCLHSLLLQAIRLTFTDDPSLSSVLASLVTLLVDRASVSALLSMSDCIDLIIPRGSSSMIASITSQTKIPVMGHSEGVCHVYIDDNVGNDSKAIDIVVDSKCDYPAACNAVETVLIHRTHCQNDAQSLASKIIAALSAKGVTVYAGPRLREILSTLPLMKNGYHWEYSDLACTIETVDAVTDAITHINTHGSHHTDAIVTDSPQSTAAFQSLVDSACVFVNSSTRFADGFRFGLGAEVGISTGRLHARGPVGADGLCTYKWLMRSTSASGHTVTQHNAKQWNYTHQPLPVMSSLAPTVVAASSAAGQ